MKTLKIIVVGPYQAGKSTFIKTAKGIGAVDGANNAYNDSDVKQLSTVATDFEKILIDQDMMLYLFGMAGQQRFDFMWDLIEDNAHGFIILFDNTRPETFVETRKMIDLVCAKTHAPYIVTGTSNDADLAWQPDDLRKALNLSQQLKLLNCSVEDITSVKKVILELLYEILNKYEG